MNNVYWIRRTWEDVPASNLWLSPAEQQRLDSLRIPKRRSDWRLGRWTAKQAVGLCLNLASEEYRALARIEVRAAASGAPEVFLRDMPVSVALSLSHRDGVCICAVASASVDLGCDVETIELHSAEFISDYFDVRELEAVAKVPSEDRIWLVSLMWSAKESALKAVKEGLRADVRSVHVDIGAPSADGREWSPLQVTVKDRRFRGWWKTDGTSVYTFAGDPPISSPTLLIGSEAVNDRAANF